MQPNVPVQNIVAVHVKPEMIEFMRKLILHETSKSLEWDESGLDGVLLATGAHEVLYGHGVGIPNTINILREKDPFIYIELSYMDKPPADAEDGENPISFNRRYTYLVDAHSQTAMLVGHKF